MRGTSMVNKRLLKREISNLAILINIAKHHGFRVFFWSLADGLSRRMHLHNLYQKTHYYRHEACKDYLKKEYSYVIDRYRNIEVVKGDKIGPNSTIWRYWHQGTDECPYPVDITLESIYGKEGNHPVVVLDKTSYGEFVDIPDYIREKCENGHMNLAVFSDYLRIALLHRYGGIWLDSTFYVDKTLPPEMDDMFFYSINQGNERDWVVTRDRWSVGLLACGKDNSLMAFCEDFLKEYWKRENRPIAYLMTDCIIGIAYDEIPAIREMIDSVPVNNKECFVFMDKFGADEYNKKEMDELRKKNFIYQLSYKNKWSTETSGGAATNFGKLISY